MSLRVLIVEDEPLGYRRLLEILQPQPDVEVVGWARNADAAIEAIRTLQPNVVFLDVQMPGSSGLDVVRTIGVDAMPQTVFVTAHDEYAVEAFELSAVDYLLKPYTDERVEDALTRVRRALAAGTLQSVSEQLQRLIPALNQAPSGRGPSPEPYLARIAVESGGTMRVIPVSRIDRIHADRVYAELHVGDERLLVRESLTSLEQKLDPNRFCRIHRSDIVALDSIDSYSRSGGDYTVQLKTGESLSVGRSYRKELERRLGCL